MTNLNKIKSWIKNNQILSGVILFFILLFFLNQDIAISSQSIFGGGSGFIVGGGVLIIIALVILTVAFLPSSVITIPSTIGLGGIIAIVMFSGTSGAGLLGIGTLLNSITKGLSGLGPVVLVAIGLIVMLLIFKKK